MKRQGREAAVLVFRPREDIDGKLAPSIVVEINTSKNMMVRSLSLLLLLLVGAAQGFVSPSTRTIAPTQLSADATGFDNFCIEADQNRAVTPEDARRFRRTVYTHDDWKKHRQQSRFTTYVGSTFKSGIWSNAKNEVLITTMITTFIVVYNALRGGYTDFAGVQHAAPLPGQVIGLPLSSFTLTGSSLGLLLSKYSNSGLTRRKLESVLSCRLI